MRTGVTVNWTMQKQAASSSGNEVERLLSATNAMHALLVKRADELFGCTEDSPAAAELTSIVNSVEKFEEMPWPLGQYPRRPGLDSRLQSLLAE